MCRLKTGYTGFERGARGRLSDWRGAGYGLVRELGIRNRGRRRGGKKGNFFVDVGCARSSGTTISLAAGGRVRVVRRSGSDGEANATVVVIRLLNGR